MQIARKFQRYAMTIAVFLLIPICDLAATPVKVSPAQIATQSSHLLGPDLEPYSGPTLILFWASWCHRCSSMFAELATLAADYPHAKVVALSIDDDKKDALAYLQKQSTTATDLSLIHFRWDDRETLKTSLDVQSVPTLILLSKDSTVLSRNNGHLKKADLFLLTKELGSANKGALQ